MKSNKRLSLSCLVFAATCFLMTQAWGASLSITPNATTIDVNQNFGVEIWIGGLEDLDLGAFDFNVLFDQNVLAFNAYTLGDGLGDVDLGDAWDLSLGDNGAGSINLAGLSFLSDLSSQGNQLLLVTLSFTGMSPGNSTLSFEGILMGDAEGGSIDISSAINGNVTVNTPATAPVPEPSTALLLGIGAIGLATVQQKRSKRIF